MGFTGVTDFGLGVDLALPCFSPLFFCEVKQHLFPISPRKEGVKLLAVGSYGITILPNQRHTSKYYLYGVLLGLRTDENTLYTLGVGNLKDPRYFYNFINSEVNTSVHYTIHGGIEFKKHIFQVQYIHRKDPSHSGIINFGIGFK